MIPDIGALRQAFQQTVVQPSLRIALRRLTPGWTQTVVRLSNYRDVTDLRSDGAHVTATGTLLEFLGNWRTVIPFDAVTTDVSAIRFFQPWAYGANATQLLVFAANSFAHAQPWETPLRTLNLNPTPRPKTRGGAYFHQNTTGFYYVTQAGSIAHIPFTTSGVESQAPQIVANTQHYGSVWGACIAPLRAGEWLIVYNYNNDRRLLLDYYRDGQYVFRERILALNYEHELHWSYTHWFDAVYYGEAIVFVASSHAFGASRSYSLYEGVVGGPYSIMAFDEMDWTGTFRVASLNVIHNRIYGVYGLRLLLGNGGYSNEVWGLCWANTAANWALPSHLVLGSGVFAGKVLLRSNEIGIVTATAVWKGEATADFGVFTNPNTQVDIQHAVKNMTYDALSDGSGASCRITIDLQGRSPDTVLCPWWQDAHQVVLHAGVGDQRQQIAVLWLDRPTQTHEFTLREMTLTARGSLAKLLDTIRPTDDIMEKAIQASHDMENSRLHSRGKSIWRNERGVLRPTTPGENRAYHPEPIMGDVYGNTRLVYENNALAFGLIFAAGGSQDGEEDYTYYLLSFHPSGNGVNWHLRKRTGTPVNKEWTQTEAILQSGTLTDWPAQSYRTLIFSMQGYVLRVWYHSPTNAPGVLLLQRTLPDCPREAYYGIWAQTRHTQLSESNFAGTTVLRVSSSLSNWPLVGEVRIGEYRYRYTKLDDTRLSITPGLQRFESKDTNIELSDSNVLFDVYNIASGHRRLCVAEVVEKVALYAGLFVRNETILTASDCTMEGNVSKQGGVFHCVNGYVRTPLLVGTSKVGLYFRDLKVNGRVSVLVGASAYTLGRTSSGYYIQSPFTNMRAIAQGNSQGWLHVVLYDGWVHFYLNFQHVGSLPDSSIGQRYAKLSFEGRDVILGPFDIPLGHEMVATGVWDARTSARAILERVLEGLPYFLTETEQSVLRLQSYLRHDDLGTVSPIYQIRVGQMTQVLNVPTAYIVEGGYDWDIIIAHKALSRWGLNWGFIRNPAMLNSSILRHFANSQIQRLVGETKALELQGRPDPAAQINDLVHYQNEAYIISGIHLLYTANPPQFNARYELVGAPLAVTPQTWGQAAWNRFDWS